jgi:protein farnesyltransferase/geranylgeranyltransferase type-1 subunit alpha
MDKLIEEDIYNNSAWSHRYFCVFGYEELMVLESVENLDPKNGGALRRKDLVAKRNGGSREDGVGNLLSVNESVRDREVEYTKRLIERAPMNLSAWNYLKGVMKRCDISDESFLPFCESFVRATDEDKAAKLDFMADSVRSSHAIAMIADVHAARYIKSMKEGKPDEKAMETAKSAWDSLAMKWDPIRKNYWEWRGMGMEKGKVGLGVMEE